MIRIEQQSTGLYRKTFHTYNILSRSSNNQNLTYGDEASVTKDTMSPSIDLSTKEYVDETGVTRATAIECSSELDHNTDVNYFTSVSKSQRIKFGTFERKGDDSESTETTIKTRDGYQAAETPGITKVNEGTLSHSIVHSTNKATMTAPMLS